MPNRPLPVTLAVIWLVWLQLLAVRILASSQAVSSSGGGHGDQCSRSVKLSGSAGTCTRTPSMKLVEGHHGNGVISAQSFVDVVVGHIPGIALAEQLEGAGVLAPVLHLELVLGETAVMPTPDTSSGVSRTA
jgi:hypothetical protein